jgi:hypothetical protein
MAFGLDGDSRGGIKGGNGRIKAGK